MHNKLYLSKSFLEVVLCVHRKRGLHELKNDQPEATKTNLFKNGSDSFDNELQSGFVKYQDGKAPKKNCSLS